jgi:hypothetical protein|tara:strand:+ start:20132 stop:20755 length:624 start_codon:yes stop_codon:yes gene_type:complete
MSDWTLITGTGRSGTSCFAKLMNACFPDRPMPGADYWNENVNAGCEGNLSALLENPNLALPPGVIVKDPRAEDLLRLVNIGCIPSFVFVCFRPLHLSAESRMSNQMKYFGPIQHTIGVDYQSRIMQGLEHELRGTSKLQYLNDHVAVGMIMDTIWQHNIPHAILKYPDFVTDAETLYEQVNAALPIDKDVFMEKHAEIMDPSLVHKK